MMEYDAHLSSYEHLHTKVILVLSNIFEDVLLIKCIETKRFETNAKVINKK